MGRNMKKSSILNSRNLIDKKWGDQYERGMKSISEIKDTVEGAKTHGRGWKTPMAAPKKPILWQRPSRGTEIAYAHGAVLARVTQRKAGVRVKYSATYSMTSNEEGKSPRLRKVAGLLSVVFAAVVIAGLSISLIHARSDLQAVLKQNGSLQLHQSAHLATLRSREKELRVSRQRLDQQLHEISALNASNATLASWISDAQHQMKVYDNSVQSLTAVLRRAQFTSKQTLHKAEEQRRKYDDERSALANDLREQRAEYERERARRNATLRSRAAGVRQRLGVTHSTVADSVVQEMTKQAAAASQLTHEAKVHGHWSNLDLRYAALKVSWRGERGATFRVLGESETELVGAVEDLPSGHDKSARHVWLPCRPNQEYELSVQQLTSKAANLAEIPGTAIHEVNFAKEQGPFTPGTRFAKPQKPSYSSAMPVSFVPKPTRLGRARCDESVTVPAAELLRPSSSSPRLIGGWRKEDAAFPSVPDVPPAAWAVGNLRQFAEEINGAWYGGKIFTRQPTQKISLRKAFRWVPHEPTMSSEQREPPPRLWPWLDLLASSGRQKKLRQGRAKGANVSEAKFWIHIAGDSIGSGLAMALALFFLKRSAKQELRSPIWKSYSTREGSYSCKNWQRFEVAVGEVRISWIHWVQTRCVRGSSARPAVSQLIELGLWMCDDKTSKGGACAQHQAATNPSAVQHRCYEQCIARPDVLLLQSGLWDVQDRPADALAGEVESLLRQLTSAHLRNTTLAWLGPLAVWRTSGEKSWRTMHRLIAHADALAPVLKSHGVLLINALQMFTGLPQDKVTPDGSHWHLDVYMDWLNVILNELGVMT